MESFWLAISEPPELPRSKIRSTRAPAKKDADIDLTDMPEVLDWSKAEVGKFYRPPKKPVTMRLDSDVVEWLKSEGPAYQTRRNGFFPAPRFNFKPDRRLNGRGRKQGNYGGCNFRFFRGRGGFL